MLYFSTVNFDTGGAKISAISPQMTRAMSAMG